MPTWRQIGAIWQLKPAKPWGQIDFIGGSYLAATPQVSYRRLLEDLAATGLVVHAWSYVPGFDHQSQARSAWSDFRDARRRLEQRDGPLPSPLRVGHSLGCKLHLLAPDGGRGCRGLVSLCFNNFQADRSIPLLGELAPRLGVETEFSPDPKETLRLIRRHYIQERNLVIRFGRDELDQSPELLQNLKDRPVDSSEEMHLPGDHLTPASAGLRRSLLGSWADDPKRVDVTRKITATISNWAR